MQYEHIVELERRLSSFFRSEEIVDLRIEKIGEDLYELKDKGGPLGKINFRAYFGVISEKNEIVVLKSYKKEENQQVPRYVIDAAEDRFEDYKAGLVSVGNSVYTPPRS